MSDTKVAAIWCRVSTDDQRELSLDSQEDAVRRVLGERGYRIPPELVLKTDWTSLDLMPCPEFQRLLGLVRGGAVQAVGIFDRDRLQAKGLPRLVFMSECDENGVEIVTVQGAPVLEGSEGQILELVLAVGKERSVLRAQQGSRDGLRDRARLKGLPPAPAKFFGYDWDGSRSRYVPDERYLDAAEVWRMALAGTSISMIVAELARKGVSTPRGKRHWTRSSVHNILANRSYAGIVEALKTEAVVPKRRAGNTYGKSTSRSRPESERIRLEGLVEHPIVSEDEYEWMRRRLQDNKRFALKNTKRRRYLLSGMVRCAECGRAYVGVSRKQGAYAYYVCGRRWNPGSGAARCESRYLRAEVVEHSVFQMVSEFLTGREGFGAEILRRQATSKVTLASLRKEIADLDRQDRGERDAEARAFNLASHNTLSEESFKEVTGLINAKRVWISEQQARALSQVEELERHQVDPDAVGTLRRRLSARLNGGTDEDRRFVLEAVGAKVIVQADGQWELELQIPRQDPEPAKPDLQIVNSSPRGPNGETRTWRRGHSTSLRVHKKAGCV